MVCSLRTLLAWGATLGAHGFALDDASALVQVNHDRLLLQPEKTGDGQCTGLRVLDFSLCTPATGQSARSNLLLNNLGGAGPDNVAADGTTENPEEMRWEKVSKIAGIGWLDLVIVNVSSWTFTNLTNGHGANADNCLAAVNIRTQTQTSLNFRLTKHGESAPLSEGGPFEIPFSVLDVDSQNRRNEEFVIVDTYMSGDSHTKLSGDHSVERVEVQNHTDGYVGDFRPIRISSKSNRDGIGNLTDNPTSPQGLEEAAEQRAVEVRFRNRMVAEWQVTAGSTGGELGRHFYFGGSSSIVPQTTRATTPCPCTEYPNTLVWGMCGDSNIVTNNLGGMGPDTGKPPVIRYGKVASIEGSFIDLVIEAMGPYSPHDVMRNNINVDRSNAGIHGCYGAINIADGTSVDLNFRLVNHGTNDTAVVGRDIRFSVYDMDSGPTASSADEYVTFLLPAAPGNISSSHHGSEVEVLDVDPLEVRSAKRGNGTDNPLETDDANTAAVYSRSVGVTYTDTSTWQVRFKASESEKIRGRNFLFAGCRDLGAWLQFPSDPFGRVRW